MTWSRLKIRGHTAIITSVYKIFNKQYEETIYKIQSIECKKAKRKKRSSKTHTCRKDGSKKKRKVCKYAMDGRKKIIMKRMSDYWRG